MFYMNQQGVARSDGLCQEAIHLLEFCITSTIHLKVSHLPSAQHNLANHLRRLFSKDHKWSHRSDFVRFICQTWGVTLIDLFANYLNRKWQIFCSRTGHSQEYLTCVFLLSWENKHHEMVGMFRLKQGDPHSIGLTLPALILQSAEPVSRGPLILPPGPDHGCLLDPYPAAVHVMAWVLHS